MAVVALRFTALPAHVRTARLVASAVARRAGVPDRVLDEVRIAVGEACSRAVDLHQRFAPTEEVRMEISDEPGRLAVTVIDAAPDPAGTDSLGDGIGSGRYDPTSFAGAAALASPTGNSSGHSRNEPADLGSAVGSPGVGSTLDFLPEGFGLAVIRALVDDVEITLEPAAVGTRVRMSWPVQDSTSSQAR